MITSAKKKFKSFEAFYLKGELQNTFIQSIRNCYENGFNGETGVVDSWFAYCEVKHGKIEQPQLKEIVSTSVSSGAV